MKWFVGVWVALWLFLVVTHPALAFLEAVVMAGLLLMFWPDKEAQRLEAEWVADELKMQRDMRRARLAILHDQLQQEDQEDWERRLAEAGIG